MVTGWSSSSGHWVVRVTLEPCGRPLQGGAGSNVTDRGPPIWPRRVPPCCFFTVFLGYSVKVMDTHLNHINGKDIL